ncbi:UNVERIFIED_CONTAM: hypothetical protein Scaly_2790000 [Sesamum calycinum]|uniref:CCHC-type domain-containing protein n=1 Tax=Sesamum calycinum TaxID=2727403 RepID=A0AAW2IWI9_9LAMI
MADEELLNALIAKTNSLDCMETTPPLIAETTNNPNQHSIIGKVISHKAPNINALKSILLKAWGISKNVTVNTIDQSTLVFVLDREEDFKRVWSQVPWCFRGNLVVLQPWPPEKALAEVDLSKVHIWIQAIGLPVLFVNKENAEKIGNYVGSFVKADLKSDSQRWNRALRIRVEIDVNKPLRDRFVLQKPDGSSILIEIRYKRLGEYCYVCGVIGHKLDLCPKTNQNPNLQNFSFGPWLEAENVLIKNPNLQTTLGVLPPPKQARNETFGAKTNPTPKPGATCKGMEICPL